jgi:uncharacterized protein YprB with RNaseH-like and TPR domain
MDKNVALNDILFLDIETVPEIEKYDDLTDETQELFAQKTKYQRRDEFTPEEFYERAGIWAEFGRIVCISVGFFNQAEKQQRQFRVTSFSGDEVTLLEDFRSLVEQHFSRPEHVLCAHNGKEFDFPYIARRMIIHKIPLPEKLKLFGKKPWEIAHIDTMEMWKFGDYKHYTSLKLLTKVLGVPSPKDEIDGSEVARVYYEEKDIKKITSYCEGDVIAIAQVYLRYQNEKLLETSAIVHV